MAIDVSRFHVAAQTGGALKVDQQNADIVAPQTTLGGKIAKFFHRETNAEKLQRINDNINVRDAFVDSLKQRYGDNATTQQIAQQIKADPTKALTAREVKGVFKELHKAGVGTVTLTNPATGLQAQIPLKSLPQSLVSGTPNLQQALQNKVNNGQQIVNALVNNNNPPQGPATMQDVADVMWFLQVAAEQRNGQTFKQGAVTLPDPGGRVTAFLDSNPEVYQRKSSHLDENGGFQANGNAHRGIDMHSGHGLATQLPNSRNHILYGFLPSNANNLHMPDDRLFVKLEGHGAYLWGDPVHGRDVNGPADRGVRGHDVKDGLAHGGSFLSGLKDKILKKPVDPDARKERIPNDVKDQFKQLTKAFQNHPELATLTQDNPTGISRGIRVMAQNLTLVSGNLANMIANNQGDPVANQMLKQGVDGMLQSLTQRYGGGVQLTERIGNEVILEHGDI